MAKSTTEKNAALQGLIDRYDQLVAERNLDGLLPFLQNETEGNRTAFKKHVLKMRRHLTDFIEFDKEQLRNGRKNKWGTRGDDTQCKIVNLTALALLNASDTANFSNEIALLQNYPTDPCLRAVIAWAKPAWIARAIKESFDKNEWFSFDYRLLRTLEADGVVEFSPRLFALTLASPKWFRHDKDGQEWLHFLSTDATVVERDLPLVFDYETSLHNRGMVVKTAGQQFQLWDHLFEKLLAAGKLDRRFFIEQSLRIQTKNWNNAAKLFFRKRLDAAGPTDAELIGHQHTLFSFLHESFPQVVNFGMEKIKQIHQHPDFDLAAFLDWLPPMLIRQDVGASVKKALQVFDYFFKSAPDRRQELLAAAADVLVSADLELQQQAARRILKNGQAGDAMLVEKLEGYQSQMLGHIRQSLVPLMGEPAADRADTTDESRYHYQPAAYRLLEEEIVLPESWNEVMFLISRYLSSREPLDAELILNTYQTRWRLFPADSSAQLKPLLKQVAYWDHPGHVEINNYMNGFLLADPAFMRRLDAGPETHIRKLRVPAPYIFRYLIGLTRRKIVRRSPLPLLCFPTHRPFWVEPKTLVQRLLDYQAAGEKADRLDLAVAISRMPRENAGEAVELLPQLNPELRRLMEFCFGTSTQIFLKSENWRSRLLSLVGRNSEDAGEIAVWAVAARTFDPDGIFSEFEKTSLGEVPNVTRPFSPEIHFVRHPKREIPPRWKGGKPVIIPAFTDLSIALPAYRVLPLHLLYSAGLFERNKNNDWRWGEAPENALAFLHSLIPQNPAPLVWHCIFAQSGFAPLLQAIRRPETRWTPPVRFAFCMAFYDEDKPTRFQAAELLHFLIEENRLDAALFGRQLGDFVFAKFSVLARLLEGLESVKDVSPKHNAALFEVLDCLFAQFYENTKSVRDEPLPTNFRKLVEYYADLQVKTGRPASAAALGCFHYLEENAALKKLVSQIKSVKK